VQEQSQTISQIQQNTQQIAQNTCAPNWTCGGWSACSDSSQTRTCSDANNCGTLNNKPSESQSCVMPLPPLVFTQTPKLVWKVETCDLCTEPVGLLSYIVWETNRPSHLVVSPVFPDETGWTTQFGASESCNRAGLSYDVNSTCRIVVEDDHGYQVEHTITVFGDRIDI
jgi:hypothetical protein